MMTIKKCMAVFKECMQTDEFVVDFTSMFVFAVERRFNLSRRRAAAQRDECRRLEIVFFIILRMALRERTYR